MERILLERLGIGWNDSVAEANEKRMKEYDRQLEEALDYVDEYKLEWEKSSALNSQAILEKRKVYEKGFVTEEGKTQLAVSIRIDDDLRRLLSEAREDVIRTVLNDSKGEDMENSDIWIPDFAHIQDKDLHITVCIPSLWRQPTADEAKHNAYNAQVAHALRTIAADHEAFVLEVDRVLLTKDGSLLGLFRTVGEAAKEADFDILSDRASETLDPMTSLRSDVLYVFLEKKLSHLQRQNELDLAQVHEHPHLLRQATIVKTVGGSAHGYIHCSLCRLAIAPDVSKKPIDWKALHRVCRSWTAKLTGRRLAVRGFTLSEMTGLGQGRNKNPFDKARWFEEISLKQKTGPLAPKISWLQRFLPCFPCFL